MQQGTLVLNAGQRQPMPSSGVSGVSPGATLQMGSDTPAPGKIYGGVNNMNGTFDLNGMSEGLDWLERHGHGHQQRQPPPPAS